MKFEIRKLCPELIEDYLHFFDVTPHSERPDDDGCKCYCVWWCNDVQDKEVFDRYLGTKENRKVYAAESIRKKRLQGYLAYMDGRVVGWCNANKKTDCYECFCWKNFMTEIHREEAPHVKVKSIFCFAVSPDLRGKGIASRLLKRVCDDAKTDGFDYVEGYPNKSFQNQAEDFMGPRKLYEKEGFLLCYETEMKSVMRKALKTLS